MSEGPVDKFLRSNKSSPSQQFLKDVFKIIPDGKNKKALIIGAEISDYYQEYEFPEKNGYELIAYDTELILWEVFFTKNILKTSDFLPKVDLIMANSILPLFGKEFEYNWKLIEDSLIVDGYFIGTFWKINPLSQYSTIKIHTKEELKILFKNFKLIKFEEVQKENHIEFWVFAQKCFLN